MFDPTVIRLFISQVFLGYILLVLVPIKTPVKRNTFIVILWMVIITIANALMIVSFGLLSFYIRYYSLTLILPTFMVFYYYAVYRGNKLFFAFMSLETFGNVAIINGIFASYLLGGMDHPIADTLVRVATYLLFLPFILKLVRPQYIKMLTTLNKGWWILNIALIVMYALTYFVAFIPNPVLYRPQYFPHIYIVLLLSLFIYVIIFFLFFEIETKTKAMHEKHLLAIQVSLLETQSTVIRESEERMHILKHDLRHHLSILSEQIKLGDFEQVSTSLQNLEENIAESSAPIYCKNKVLNVTLSHYFNQAKKENITVESDLVLPESLSVNPSELALVFANAVENAIHACMKIDDISKRKMVVTSRQKNTSIFIEIANTCFEKVIFGKNNIPITSESNHGIGVISMMAFAQKNGAILDFSQENDTFYVRLVIHCP